ncbi:MAG: capsule assembly Wzi family protein [Bacteroidota bacterium]
MRKFFFLVSLILIKILFGQSTDFPIHHPAYQILELEEITSDKSFTSAIKPYSRSSVFDFLSSPESSYLNKELRRYTSDSIRSKKPILNKLYQYPADFYYYQDKILQIHINPVIQFSFGRANDDIGTTFVNSRGIEIRGNIDRKVSFYTFLTENQARYPEYINTIRDSTLVIPYEGFWKQYNDTGVDFFRAQGYIDFGLSKSISAQLGYGKHFVGNGFRSIILSNYANNYPYLRLNTHTKIFDYTNIYAQLIGDVQGNEGGTFGTSGFSEKYMTFHHLTIKIKPNLHIGFFESVMFGDSSDGFKIEYLNPVIFYRSVEQQNGSEDNAFVGFDFKWNIQKRYSFYGQLLIDEMVVSEVFAGDGWWGNKQGFQLGFKYANALSVHNLLLQAEINRVRPYTYAHEDGFTSYSHYNLALAHPIGANFTEYLGRAIYRLNDSWNFTASLIAAQYGNDIGDENYGKDILKDYTVRRQNANGNNMDYQNEHLQGNKTELLLLFGRATFMLKHNVFIDLDVTFRRESDERGMVDSNSTVVGASFRWNIPARTHLF